MIALRSLSLLALCSLKGPSSSKFVTVSPDKRTKSLLMHPFESIARKASPMDVLVELTTTVTYAKLRYCSDCKSIRYMVVRILSTCLNVTSEDFIEVFTCMRSRLVLYEYSTYCKTNQSKSAVSDSVSGQASDLHVPLMTPL